MTKEETWTPLSWYCPNCGAIVRGYKNMAGIAKGQCESCGCTMTNKCKGEQHNILEVFAYGAEAIACTSRSMVPKLVPPDKGKTLRQPKQTGFPKNDL